MSREGVSKEKDKVAYSGARGSDEERLAIAGKRAWHTEERRRKEMQEVKNLAKKRLQGQHAAHQPRFARAQLLGLKSAPLRMALPLADLTEPKLCVVEGPRGTQAAKKCSESGVLGRLAEKPPGIERGRKEKKC